MLVTPERNRRNRDQAFALAGGTAAVSLVAGWFFHPALLSLGLSLFIYWLVRRRCVRRFDDWEYHRLGEVLVYPRSFGEDYQTTGGPDENVGGMVGIGQLRGVVILSKPWLFDGFDNPSARDNVGVHEFAHLVEREVAESGVPREVPLQAVAEWVQYVARELAHPSKNRSYIRDYAYTNDREFFAVLAEYFFNSPELLKEKDPRLYGMLRNTFHQDTASLLKQTFARSSSYDPNAGCPCRSGKKFKICCRLKGGKRGAAKAIETQSPTLAKKREK